jgi:hypothetical protein
MLSKMTSSASYGSEKVHQANNLGGDCQEGISVRPSDPLSFSSNSVTHENFKLSDAVSSGQLFVLVWLHPLLDPFDISPSFRWQIFDQDADSALYPGRHII